MAQHYTDEQCAKVVALHAEGMSLRRISKETGIPVTSVRRLLERNPSETVAAVQRQAQQQAEDMLTWMENRRADVQTLAAKILKILPEKLEEANAVQAATVLGILLDKWAPSAAVQQAIINNFNFGGDDMRLMSNEQIIANLNKAESALAALPPDVLDEVMNHGGKDTG